MGILICWAFGFYWPIVMSGGWEWKVWWWLSDAQRLLCFLCHWNPSLAFVTDYLNMRLSLVWIPRCHLPFLWGLDQEMWARSKCLCWLFLGSLTGLSPLPGVKFYFWLVSYLRQIKWSANRPMIKSNSSVIRMGFPRPQYAVRCQGDDGTIQVFGNTCVKRRKHHAIQIETH